MTTPPGALSAALTDLWSVVCEHHPELPATRVVVTPGRTLADHGPERWGRGPDGSLTGLVVTTDSLRDGPDAVLTVLLHEAAHVRCWQAGEQDTTQRGRYHNLKFLTSAEVVGLMWASDGPSSAGFADPVLAPDTAALYAGVMRPMGPVIDAVLPYLDVQQPRRQSQQRLSIGCDCDPPRLARMTQTQIEKGPITCGVCGADFRPVS